MAAPACPAFRLRLVCSVASSVGGASGKAAYRIAKEDNSRALAESLSREGQMPLPLLDLVTQAAKCRLETRIPAD